MYDENQELLSVATETKKRAGRSLRWWLAPGGDGGDGWREKKTRRGHSRSRLD